jgi:hypothetical protein
MCAAFDPLVPSPGRTHVREEISDDEGLRRLREFLRDVEALLQQIEARPGRAIRGRHRPALSAAWESVRPKFDSVVGALAAAPTSHILPALRLRGLLGPELVFKLEVFTRARARYLDHGGPRRGRSKGRRWWSRWRRRLARTFGAANLMLGSLGTLFPGAEAIHDYTRSLAVAIEMDS